MKTNSLIQGIGNIMEKRYPEIQKETKEAFLRAGIVPTGQLQLRSTILTGNYPGKDVNKPLEQQRPNRLVEELGVKYLSELSSDFEYPVISDNTSQWRTETQDGDMSGIAVIGMTLSPRRMLSYVEYSNQIVLNPNTDVAGAI